MEEQVLEALMGAEGVVPKEAPPPCVPEEKKPSLSVEELEAKQGGTAARQQQERVHVSVCVCLHQSPHYYQSEDILVVF